MAISNDDRIGDYYVTVIAKVKQVAAFQVPDLPNAREEANKLWYERNKKGLTTKRIFAREITGKKNGLQLSEVEYEL